MRTASRAFGEAVRAPHELAVRCDVLFNREVVAEDIPIHTGVVSGSRRRSVQGSLEITLSEPVRVPAVPDDLLTPFGYELRIWRGVDLRRIASAEVTSAPEQYTLEDGATLVTLEDGTTPYTLESGTTLVQEVEAGPELLPVGTFPIQRSFLTGRTLQSEIVAEDRGRLVSDARFERLYTVQQGVNYAEAIEAVLLDGVPELEIELGATTFTAPGLAFDRFSDRWDAAQRMAGSVGWELYFDGSGVCRSRPEPTFDATPVLDLSPVLIDATHARDRTGTYNRVVAIGVNPSTNAELVGVATNDDPSSPTYYGPGFGRRPRGYYSPFIASQAQADAAAASVLAAEQGVADERTAVIAPDPRIEPADVVELTYAPVGLDGVSIVDGFTLGLDAEQPMTLEIRSAA